MHRELSFIYEITPKNEEQAVELVRSMTEALVWSEQNNQNFFEYFMKAEVPNLFRRFLSFQSKPLLIQLIQSANMLVHNLDSDEDKQYLLNTPFYGEVVTHPYDSNDEEIVENYMSLLKSLATNLKSEQLKSYVLVQNFSLYTGAFAFIDSKDQMIKTAARTVILSIFKLQDESIIQYISQSGFFIAIVLSMREQWYALDQKIMSMSNSSKLDQIIKDHVDNLYFMNDIFEQGITEINQELADLLLRHIILPVLVGSLGSERHMQHHLGIPLAAYLIIQILKTIRHPPLINTLAACLFLKEVREELLTLTMNSPPLQALAGGSRDLSPSTDAIRLGSQMLDYLDYLKEPENLRHNTIRDVIFSFLRSRDDNLVTLTVLIIQGVILNGSVSSTILWGAGLMPVKNKKKQDQLGHAIEESKDFGDEAKDSQKINYDSGVISMLLRLINLEPSFRIFTCHAICKLMLSLAYKIDWNSCLLPEHELSLKKALKRTITALKKLVKANFHDSLLLELFEEEWNRVSILKFNDKIICPSHLLLPLLNELESNIPLEHRRPSGDVEEARCNVSLFFLYRKMHHLLCAKDVNTDFDIDTYPLNYMKTPCLWKEGEVHSMGNYYLDGRTCFRCFVKDGKKEKTLYFTEDDDKFVLVEPDLELMGYAKIVIITNLRDVEAMTDRSDPRSLVLLVKQKTDNTQLTLTFEDAQRCLWIKRQIEDHRQSSKSEDMGLIEVLLNTIEECIVK